MKRRDDVERVKRQPRRIHFPGLGQMQLDDEGLCGVRILYNEDSPAAPSTRQFIDNHVPVPLQSLANEGYLGLRDERVQIYPENGGMYAAYLPVLKSTTWFQFFKWDLIISFNY